MNKTTKKFVVTLLSVLMVLSFMPAMAFAETVPSDLAAGHNWVLDPDATIEPTCLTPGVDIWTCTGQDFANGDHLDCSAIAFKLKDYGNHVPKDYPIQLSTEDYIKRYALENELDAEEVQAMYEDLAPYCYVFAMECKTCGDLIPATVGDVDYPQFLTHDPVSDTPVCAESFKCKYCGATVERDVPDEDHTWDAGTVIGEGICSTGEDGDGYTITEFKCSKCKKTKKVVERETERNQVLHQGIGTPVTPKEGEEANYVEYKGKYYAYNEVLRDPTCESTGVGCLRCSKCGQIVTNHGRTITCTIPATGHDFKSESFPATCTTRGFTVEVCQNEGCYAWRNLEYKEDALGHDYYVTPIIEPNHFQQGLTFIGCSRCLHVETADDLLADGRIVKVDAEGYFEPAPAEKDVKGLYFIGFDGDNSLVEQTSHGKKIKSGAIKVDDWTYKEHKDYGMYDEYLEATCTSPAYNAKKCECGYIDVHSAVGVGEPLGHDVKTYTVDPTCGEWGYTYSTCERCKLFIDEDGVVDPYADTPYEAGYAWVKPLVAEGTPCQFEWTVIKAPTSTEDGEEALVCSKCKAIKPNSQTVIPKDSDKAKDIAISLALPIIGNAADIINDTANYKASSIAAIKEAKDILNGAIASGNAADVNRAAEALDALVKAAEKKDANPMVAKAKTVKAKSSKKTTIKKAKAFTVKKAQGKVTFKKASGNKKITVSKAGKVTVKKGLKKGKTYKVKVKVTAAGNGNYLKKTKTVTLKVKITK